ncbi:uncharacterized protein LOC129884905 [Solanum dulcamara]|uniref:uncharacterized protein LOC129884905 n=1 Tax=Solanum dulcamara TaxID=45834 RepID=UPI0024865DC3|nr:uncharacterized protein LOC129884905 [Solanum dulcamara]
MQEKSRTMVARRAWNVLRLSLLWARKGGIFKNKHLVDLRLLPKYIKSLRHNNDHYRTLHYGEREFSFDDTPIFHVKMHRPASLRFKMPNIPCIKPQVDVDFDFDNDYERDDEMYPDNNNDDTPRKSFLSTDGEEDEYVSCEMSEEIIASADDEAIDMKAEEFIAKFYEQIKLQRQLSYLQYHEKLAN